MQYSVPLCVAVALVDDADDPMAFGERALRNPAVHALAQKITCESWKDAPSGWASEVHVTLRDGRTLQRAEDDFPGTPTRALSAAQLRAKFLRCGGGEALLEELERIATVPDVYGLAGVRFD